jgi:carbamate kinase
MLVVASLGGQALLRRGEPLTPDHQRPHIRILSKAMASIAANHQLVIGYGNGPEAGLLVLQGVEYAKVEACPVDVVAAQVEFTVGYLIEQELGNLLPPERAFATVLTMVEVDPDDPAFQSPSTFIGPVYLKEEAERISRLKHWVFKPNGDKWQRVVAAPQPKRIVELRPIRWLLEHGTVIIAAGGGGIPILHGNGAGRGFAGVDCVIDPDHALELLARELRADVFVMLTDADAVYVGWGMPSQKAIRRASPDALATMSFGGRSTGPKLTAACRFATATGNRAAIGAAPDFDRILAGTAGTTISVHEAGITYAGPVAPAGRS